MPIVYDNNPTGQGSKETEKTFGSKYKIFPFLIKIFLIAIVLYIGSTDSFKNIIATLIPGQIEADKLVEKSKEPVKEANFIKDTYLNKIDRADDIKRKSDLRDMRYALELYFLENGNYPISVDSVKLNEASSPVYKELTKYANPNSLKDPKEPEFFYLYRSDGKSFEISARLENNKDSECEISDGDICTYKISAP